MFEQRDLPPNGVETLGVVRVDVTVMSALLGASSRVLHKGLLDGYEQGHELSMGLTFVQLNDQWAYDIGTHIGASLRSHPDNVNANAEAERLRWQQCGWGPAYAEVAEAEGWGIFTEGLDDSGAHIQRDDEKSVFSSDGEAQRFVWRKACDGSAPHAAALLSIAINNPVEFMEMSTYCRANP